MPLKREFARKFDETQSTLPYNECDDSEKALRRRLAIRLKLLEEERVKKEKNEFYLMKIFIKI